MKKGIFYIPCYPKNTKLETIIEEIRKSVVFCDGNNFKEAYFGEHLADRYEKITSSLNIIASLSFLTKKIMHCLCPLKDYNFLNNFFASV